MPVFLFCLPKATRGLQVFILFSANMGQLQIGKKST